MPSAIKKDEKIIHVLSRNQALASPPSPHQLQHKLHELFSSKMLEKIFLGYFRSAVVTCQRSSLNISYCFVWDCKHRRIQPLTNEWNIRGFQVLTIIMILVSPIFLGRCYQVTIWPRANENEMTPLIIYWITFIGLLFLQYAVILMTPSGAAKLVKCYEQLMNMEKQFEGKKSNRN